jgi:HAD superfamily hydrolase (TIGR01509 family)
MSSCCKLSVSAVLSIYFSDGAFIVNLPGACIFDMDELLLASVPQWRASIDHLLEAIDTVWTPELAVQYQGMNANDVAKVIHREVGPPISAEECTRILREALLQRFSNEVLQPMPGAIECVQRLSAQFPCAVASGSPLPCIETAMRTLEIAPCFDTMLSSESVPRGKPHPDVFLAAAAALQVEPSHCVVFEDSLAGVKAARAAGMKTVVVPSSYDQEEVRRLADCVFDSLAQVTVDDLRLFD